MFESLRLSDLETNNCGVLRRPSSTRPMIWRIEEKGVRAIVKDFSVNRPFYRNTVGRFLVWRESKAYKMLRDIRGVPVLFHVIDGLAMVIEEIPSRNLEKLEREMKLPVEFFDALKELVDKIHERGLAHCDLKRAPNTLMGEDGLPYIIDWGASVSENEFRFPLFTTVYRKLVQDDYNAITKLKLRHIPAAISAEEMARYRYRSGVERIVRSFRDKLREWFQKIV